jgi:hypothetical protein
MREQAIKLGRVSRTVTLNRIRSQINQRSFVEFDKLRGGEVRDRGHEKITNRAFEAKLFLVQVAVGAITALGTFLWNRWFAPGNSSQGHKVYKEGEEEEALPNSPPTKRY